jgi:hypothetical protein
VRTPKRVNSKRPSLWYKSHAGSEYLRIYYPDGKVDILYLAEWGNGVWFKSSFSNQLYPKRVVKGLMVKHDFLGYL